MLPPKVWIRDQLIGPLRAILQRADQDGTNVGREAMDTVGRAWQVWCQGLLSLIGAKTQGYPNWHFKKAKLQANVIC